MDREQVDKRYLATTVLKTIDVMNLLAKHEMTAAEICEALDLNKSTMHRLLYTLEYAGFIEKKSDQRTYRLGIKLVQLCSLRINDIELITESKSFLLALVKHINQTVHLAVMSNNSAMYIDKIDAVNTVRIYSAIGRLIPLHCSAVGKALLLDKSDSEVLQILSEVGMPRFTSHTLVTASSLLEQLHVARQYGYTVDDCEHEDHVCCIATPIYDYRGQIIASISTAVLKTTSIDRDFLIESLKDTAQKISAALGYNESLRA